MARSLLAFWFTFATLLGPSVCCCSPCYAVSCSPTTNSSAKSACCCAPEAEPISHTESCCSQQCPVPPNEPAPQPCPADDCPCQPSFEAVPVVVEPSSNEQFAHVLRVLAETPSVLAFWVAPLTLVPDDSPPPTSLRDLPFVTTSDLLHVFHILRC